MIRGLLLDLDGTLLDIDIEPFLGAYFDALGPALAGIVGNGTEPETALKAVLAATNAMCADHLGRTNRQVFDEVFEGITGTDLNESGAAAAIERFYEEVFPTLRGSLQARPGADGVVRTARELGLRIVVATNPIFPLSAIRHRLDWAGFTTEQFDAVTSYETSQACKPSPAYFRHVAEGIGIEPSACLMVGDDPVMDMAAADVGMKTFYVGRQPAPVCDWTGDLHDLAALLTRIAQA